MISFRLATYADHPAIAAIHANSWIENYKGILSDQFLTNEVQDNRLKLWESRLSTYDSNQLIIVATEASDIIAFSCTFLDYDLEGNYLDNLHVKSDYKGKSIGRTLMHYTASQLIVSNQKPLYLWVFVKNKRAIDIYKHWNGEEAETQYLDMPSGGGGGIATKIKWSNPNDLIIDGTTSLAIKEYRPIVCELYDQFEITVLQKRPISLVLMDGSQLNTIIKTLQTQEKIEYLVTEEDHKIRLDQISKMCLPNGEVIVDLSINKTC